jgi:hypothetical protein
MAAGSSSRPPVDLLRPYDADKMTAWKVDRAVGNVKNDRAELIDPIQGADHLVSAFQPAIIVLRRNNDWHPVM